ncbi:MAG: hypothetical protein GXO22_02570 [Aquificae bacterium]|nr:hypothetical protein [Aquificota bacterium]
MSLIEEGDLKKIFYYLERTFSIWASLGMEIYLWDQNFKQLEIPPTIEKLLRENYIYTLFPSLNLYFFNKKSFISPPKYDFSISMDSNIARYIHEYVLYGKESIFFKGSKEKLDIVLSLKDEDINFDSLLYIIENEIKSHTNYDEEKFFETLVSLEKFKNPNENPEKEALENFNFIKKNPESIQIFKLQLKSLKLIVSAIVYAKWKFSKKEERVRYLMNFMHSRIGAFYEREFLLAINYFENSRVETNFFEEKIQPNINLKKLTYRIENLASDLLLIRFIEYLHQYREKRYKPHIKNLSFIPFFLSFDKNLKKIMENYHCKAIIVIRNHNEVNVIPVFLEKKKIFKAIEKYSLEEFFTQKAKIDKTKRKQFLEKSYDKFFEEEINKIKELFRDL